jgi:multiple sugar transport system ATP-binding protein
MGRAIVREPSVFLMDEPLSNLDAKLRVETRANIAELQSRLGTTTVYVTHDQVEAMTMGHRVAVLKDGILNQVDTPRTLYDKPVNVFVAGFMGSPAMNLLTVPLVGDGAQLGDATFALPRSVLSEASAAGLKEVTFGVRPENITLADKGIPVTIDLVEELGADAFVHGHTPDGNRLVIRADARIHPSQGSTVYALPTDADHCHVFDPNTGIRFKSSDAVPADAANSSITLGKRGGCAPAQSPRLPYAGGVRPDRHRPAPPGRPRPTGATNRAGSGPTRAAGRPPRSRTRWW